MKLYPFLQIFSNCYLHLFELMLLLILMEIYHLLERQSVARTLFYISPDTYDLWAIGHVDSYLKCMQKYKSTLIKRSEKTVNKIISKLCEPKSDPERQQKMADNFLRSVSVNLNVDHYFLNTWTRIVPFEQISRYHSFLSANLKFSMFLKVSIEQTYVQTW